jgi:DNA repair exonuclease SbcCD ATPase subunit
MPAAIDNSVKTNAIKQWLDGDTRDKIASDNQIGAGTVSGIINEWKQGINAMDYESVRELSVWCKKQGINLSSLASSLRTNNYVQKLGANQEQIEIFISNLANSPQPEKLIDVANQIAQISTSESISLEELENRVKQKEKEKKMLEEEIKQRRAILENTNVDITALNEYKKLKEQLGAHGLSLKDPQILLSILKTIREIGYDPQKIIREFQKIKSFRETEKHLNNKCKALEARLRHCREVLPMCEQIMHIGIGFPELLAFHTAVVNKAERDNLPKEAAAYRVMEDIENYEKIGGLKNEISKMVMQKYAIDQMTAPREKAINSLIRLQAFGITDEEILGFHGFLNMARSESATKG